MPQEPINAKCDTCGAERVIYPEEVEPGDMPICSCGGVMFPHIPEPEQGEL